MTWTDADDYSRLLDDRGQVRPECTQDLLVEVMSGKVIFQLGGLILASRWPTEEEFDAARTVYVRKQHECIAAGVMTRSEIESASIDAGVFDASEIEQKKILENMIERNRKARDKTQDPSQKLELDAEIINLQSQIEKLEETEVIVYRNAAETIAEQARGSYLTAQCTLGGMLLNERLWPTWEVYQKCDDHMLIMEARKAHVRVIRGLPGSIIRSLSRTAEWTRRWKSSKDSRSPVFGGPSNSWTVNQTALIDWSHFYDSVRDHPECPSEEIIQNDEALQAWITRQGTKKGSGHSGGRGTVSQVDGKGRRTPMQSLGSKTKNVNTPYRVRA